MIKRLKELILVYSMEECYHCKVKFECSCKDEHCRLKHRSCSNRSQYEEGSRSQMITDDEGNMIYIHLCSIECEDVISKKVYQNMMKKFKKLGIKVTHIDE